MKIKEVTVRAERIFNHPHKSLKLRPSLSITAQVSKNENPEDVIMDLQARAEILVEEHRDSILDAIGIFRMIEEEKNL